MPIFPYPKHLLIILLFLFSTNSLAASITVFSGNNQTGTVDSILAGPLVVTIDCSDVPPILPPTCGTVTWSSSDRGDSFTEGTTGTTGPPNAATSQNSLAIGPNAGTRTITATALGLLPPNTATFTITGEAISSGEPTDEQEVQQEAANEQTATTAGTALAAVKNGNSSITNRLGGLHQGNNTGVDISGVNFNLDGNTISFGDIQGWLGPKQGGGAGDDSSIFGDRLGVFMNGNFSFGDHDRTSREAGFDFDILGTTVGADYRITDQLFLGTAFQYASTDSDFDRSGGGLDADTYSVSLYSSYNQPGSFYLDGILRFGWSDFELDRNFSIGGTRQKAKADYDGIDYSVSVSGGYDFVFDAFSVEPFARIEYVAVDIDSYREKANSAGAAASLLDVNQQNLQSLRTTLGGQASYVISTSYGVYVPTLRIEWQHEYKNNSRTIRSSLISNPAATPVSVQSNKPDRNFLNLGTGVTAVFAHGVSGFLYYEALLGNQYLSQHTVNLGVRMEF